MNSILNSVFLSASPIIELRGGIPFAIGQGINPFFAFFICVLANIIIIPFIFMFLIYFHKHFEKNRFYSKLFNKFVVRTRRRVSKHIGTKWEYLALLFLVAIPSPGTGAYTGTLAAWLFNLNKK